MNNFDRNNYLDQYRDIKLFCKKYVGEPMLSPITTYNKMKNWYVFRIIYIRFQIDQKSRKKIRLFEEYDDDPVKTLLYIILVKHRQTEMISDGSKVVGIELVEKINDIT